MAADWSVPIGITVFIVGIIVAAYLYLRYRKLHLVGFVAAIVTYIFAVFYTWDVFDLQRNAVMGLLLVSTALMIGVGKYFETHQVFSKDNKHTKTTKK